MEQFLAGLEPLLLYLFAICALIGSILVVALRQPMRVAMALISTMIFLGGVYGLLGVHFIAAFQVLIYVGAVMVFMVYVIMLLDVRDPSYTRRFSGFLMLGLVAAVVFVEVLVWGFAQGHHAAVKATVSFGFQQFAAAFLNEYWLHFELTSVLLVAA